MFHSKPTIFVFAFLVLAALLMACQSGGTTEGNVTAVAFEANDSGCNPNNIETFQGNLMKLTLKNSGTAEVKLVFPDVPYTLTAAPGQTVPGNFTAPTKPGSYNFTCGSTNGKIQVKSN